MNTGDVPALSKLLLSHCDKKCVVNIPKFSSDISVGKLVQIFDKLFDVHPDCVALACAHQTKIVGNQISSSLFLKLTDIKIVQDVIRPSLQDPVLNELFGNTREQRMHRLLVRAQSPEEETQIPALEMMVDSQLEFSEDLTSIENVDEILLNSFLEFDFDFPEEIRTSPGKRKVCDGASQTEVSLTCASNDSGRSNHTKKKSRKSNERTTEEQQIEYYTKPIYAFPSFVKSDALIYLPNTLSLYMNTGDVPALSKLLLSHCDKKCIVDFPKSASEINVRKLV
eukprot:gene10452-12212_t